MKILKSNNLHSVAEAIKILSRGGIIVYPTDTLYGFGVDATNESAIKKLNNIKGRTSPISVIAPNTDTALSWMDININQSDLVPFYLGGAKTLIVPVKSGITSPMIFGPNKTLGIRIPNHTFCIQLSTEFGKPITTTSVNRTNENPLNDPELIIKEFEKDIDLFIHEGTLPDSKGSTIYILENNNITILRE